MTAWEHRTVVVGRGRNADSAPGDWQVDFGDGEVLVGLQTVLDYYGSRGWELVTLLPQTWAATSGQFGPWDITQYRAVFKRATPGSAGSNR